MTVNLIERDLKNRKIRIKNMIDKYKPTTVFEETTELVPSLIKRITFQHLSKLSTENLKIV